MKRMVGLCVSLLTLAAIGQEGMIVGAEQHSRRVVLFDGTRPGPTKITWAWAPDQDEGVKAFDRKFFGCMAECKPSANNGEQTLLVVGSAGGFAEVSLKTARALVYGVVELSPHSIAKLPDPGVYVIASAMSNCLTVVDTAAAPLDPARQRACKYPFFDAHGVEWDAQRRCLWALGRTNLVSYAWVNRKLQVQKSYDIRPAGGPAGHDLVPDGEGRYLLTTTSSILRFDPDQGTFDVLRREKEVKSVSPSPQYGLLLGKTREVWWTDRAIVERDGTRYEVGPFQGTQFYKFRWLTPFQDQSRVSVPGAWTHLPPTDLDPKWANMAATSPRKWSGQKASLRYADVYLTETKGEGCVRVDWSAAASAANAPKVPGSLMSLWKGRHPDLPAVTEPQFYWVGKDLRLFRGTPPDAAVLLPVCVVEDGNPEDGYGGYLIGFTGAAAFAVESKSTEIALRGDGKPFVTRFNGNWLAALQLLARQQPTWFKAPAEMTPELWISVVAEWLQDAGKWNAPAYGWTQFLESRLARRRAILADPRLKATLENGLVFITRRQPSWNHEVAQYFGWRQEPGGSVYKLTKPGYSLAREDLIAGRHPAGSYLQPRLSYDAQKLVFAFVATEGGLDPYSVVKVNEEDGDHHYYHLWEMKVDGSGLRQLTKGVYEDFMPEFLPDGDIAFMSSRRRSQSRCFWFGYSNRWQAYTLFRMKADGTDMQQLSWNDVAEWFPTMSNDGEILFARWDYIDRDAVRHQNLWKMRPDGTNPMAVWGNETMNPHCTFQPRAIPGSRKIVCVAAAHHADTGGPIILIDPAVDENSEAAITHITPGHYPEIDMPTQAAPLPDAGTWAEHYRDNDWYNSPHPYGEDLFLVAWSREALHYEPSRKNSDAALGLYVLKAGAKGELPVRELLWRDGELSAECPTPLEARPVPPKWISQFDPALQAAKEGEVFISDVHRGLKTVQPGSLKEVRVVQIFPRTAPDQYLPNTGCGGHENARGVLGTAKVEADGSTRFVVPAKTPILFQVLDAEGRAWRTMRSTTSLMPGERVSCVGCHEPKREASAHGAVVSEAMKKPAQRLAVPPEGGRPWGFVENIQPIFDRKCISCHAGEKAPKGVDLTRTIDPRFSVTNQVKQVGYRQYSAPFTKSYATLIFTDEELPKHTTNKSKKFQWYAPRMGKDAEGKPLRMVPNWPEYNHVQTTPEGMEGRSSLTSGLMAKLSRGKHGKMLTSEEKRMVATWIDLNATFYGCYEDPDLSKQLRGEPIALPAVP